MFKDGPADKACLKKDDIIISVDNKKFEDVEKLANYVKKEAGKKVKVSWTNINGETGYQISQSTSKTGTKIVATYKTTSGKYKTVSATKGKTYYYKVRAYRVVGNTKICGPWSSVVKYKR